MKYFFGTIALILAQMVASPAQAAEVKITPVSSHHGEFCAFDSEALLQAERALIFEDPNGTRLVYDAGRTVAGGEDRRLGKIDAVLISHVHGDHLGVKRSSPKVSPYIFSKFR